MRNRARSTSETRTGERGRRGRRLCAVVASAQHEPSFARRRGPRVRDRRARRGGARAVGSSRRARAASEARSSPSWRLIDSPARSACHDDGTPVVSAGFSPRHSSTNGLSGGVLALHEEDPALSRDGVMHEGAVRPAFGLAWIPSVSESTMVARDATLAGPSTRGSLPAPVSGGVGGSALAQGEGTRESREGRGEHPTH